MSRKEKELKFRKILQNAEELSTVLLPNQVGTIQHFSQKFTIITLFVMAHLVILHHQPRFKFRIKYSITTNNKKYSNNTIKY